MRDSRSSSPPRATLIGTALLIALALGAAAPAGAAEATIDSVLKPRLYLSAGWALGSSSNAFNPALEAPGNEKFDAEPLVHLDALLGGPSGFNAEVKLVLGNFGRLVNRQGLGPRGFSPESSGTSVRRAIIADLALRSPFTRTWGPKGGLAWNFVDIGFIFDAQQDPDSTDVLDAASYLFTGPTLFSILTERSFVQIDLLLGTSELLTGVEAFDLDRQHLRFRPRLKFHIHEGGWGPFDVGFWGDLGWARREPDAFTAFVAKPLLGAR